MPRGGNNSSDHSDLCRACKDYLDAIKAWHVKLLGGLGQQPGLPDIIACIYAEPEATNWPAHFGQLVAIEAKTGSGKLTKAQREVRADMVRAGALYLEVHGIEELETGLHDAGLISRRLLT